MSLLLLALMMALGVVVGYFVLQPVCVASRGARSTEQFFLVDLISLLWLMQLPLLFFSWLSHDRSEGEVAATGAILLLAVIAPWWRGVCLLSSLGIYSYLRRIVFVGVILPAAILGSIAAVPMIWVTVSSLQGRYDMASPLAMSCLAGTLFLPAVVVTMRHLCWWVLLEHQLQSVPQKPPQTERAGDA